MKKRVLILTVTIALFFTLALATDELTYVCGNCGSDNVSTFTYPAMSQVSYVPCTCNGEKSASTMYDEITDYYQHINVNCHDCDYHQTLLEKVSSPRRHVGANPQ